MNGPLLAPHYAAVMLCLHPNHDDVCEPTRRDDASQVPGLADPVQRATPRQAPP